MLTVVNDVINLSRADEGTMRLRLDAVDAKTLVRKVLSGMLERVEQAGVCLNIEVASGIAPFVGDRDKLEQALQNYLGNAIRFSPKGETVDIYVYEDDRDIVFAVRDRGVGLSNVEQQQVFQVFSQIDGSLAHRHSGAGLGLPLTRRYVELHGGRVWVESKRGQGSSFFFCVPKDLSEQLALQS